ncbi:MAG TPA: MoxR family ATPase [Accumulibacter sp.]|uniref:AAA family ATPase n=1 Tax=Accumulibacter sp. TaxID=2053492 RepID=UPI002B9D917D|nr:MoxR family ATPase [Accumulibacter sp.]HRD92904.1 MoxR family ATPase [Accumulibacter sp.]HRF74432.1 MoxR family ATPase [Accumulibacter sp.]
MPDHRPYAIFSGRKSAAYVASAQTAEIVNLAIRLGRPLLVEGEAGCGKTRLASAIADELGLSAQLIVMTVKSTSQARDLLYRFDALRRLQDAQDPRNASARRVYPYIELEPLGYAIAQGRPSVVLIDEVDKADIDFPNDLLDVLDRFEFDIEDLPRTESRMCKEKRGFGRHVQAPRDGVKPIVIITSNREKQLPEPFLRRCLYAQLDFPTDEAILAEIVSKNLDARLDQVSDALIAAAVSRFCRIRERGRELSMQKLPATSELVDWIRVLHWQKRKPENVSPEQLTAADQAVLFKVRQDIERYRARTGEEAGQ